MGLLDIFERVIFLFSLSRVLSFISASKGLKADSDTEVF